MHLVFSRKVVVRFEHAGEDLTPDSLTTPILKANGVRKYTERNLNYKSGFPQIT